MFIVFQTKWRWLYSSKYVLGTLKCTFFIPGEIVNNEFLSEVSNLFEYRKLSIIHWKGFETELNTLYVTNFTLAIVNLVVQIIKRTVKIGAKWIFF